MARGPEDARRVIQIAVGLDVDREPSVRAVRERGADGRRRAVAHRTRALAADVLIVLVELPQTPRPAADEALPRHQRPILIVNLGPELAAQAREADRARVPSVGC